MGGGGRGGGSMSMVFDPGWLALTALLVGGVGAGMVVGGVLLGTAAVRRIVAECGRRHDRAGAGSTAKAGTGAGRDA